MVQIMWKEIIVGFMLLFIFRWLLNVYMINTYNKMARLFGKTNNVETLKKRMKKHRKLCDFFSIGPWNQEIYAIYNRLCWMLASLELLEGREDQFLQYVNSIKKGKEYEIKPFAFALYYRARKNQSLAEEWYRDYLKCNYQHIEMYLLLDYIFSENKRSLDETMSKVIGLFKNPATIILIKDNGII